MAQVRLPDGSVREVPDGYTVRQLAESIGRRLADAAIAARVDGRLVDLSYRLNGSHEVTILTDRDPESLEIMRHSAAHVMAQAMRRLYGPQLQYTIGPVIENGFYYDFAVPAPVSADDLPRIEQEMQKIIAADLPFDREETDIASARRLFADLGQRFKDELLCELAGRGETTVSLYRQGDFVDLCRGPHIPSTGKIAAFKLQSVAGAYWRGDSSREQLVRIYGVAFFDRKQLEAYLKMLEEARKRDHRVLGPQLGLFHQQEEAPGCVFWHDKGWTLWRIIENYIRGILRANGYIEVRTPQLVDRSLWERSGHWEKYADLMFVTESEKHVFAIKPMNCPCHIQIFNQATRSYRDLPLRMAEFGACHRNEPGGTLHGIMRVRAFTQDDAHIFCTEDQIASEVADFVRILRQVYHDFGFEKIVTKLATRPEKRIGSDESWDRTEKALADAMKTIGLPYEINPGEGAFYGPKLEFDVSDAIGRLWQLGTIQVDMNLPARLGCKYIGEDNAEHVPVMLHRAILGSMERFIGILIEHHAGAFPLWLAPVQVAVLSISEKASEYAKYVATALTKASLRCETDLRGERINAKVRDAVLRKIPFLAVVGEKEAREGTINVRPYHDVPGTLRGDMSVESFIRGCVDRVESKWHPA